MIIVAAVIIPAEAIVKAEANETISFCHIGWKDFEKILKARFDDIRVIQDGEEVNSHVFPFDGGLTFVHNLGDGTTQVIKAEQNQSVEIQNGEEIVLIDTEGRDLVLVNTGADFPFEEDEETPDEDEPETNNGLAWHEREWIDWSWAIEILKEKLGKAIPTDKKGNPYSYTSKTVRDGELVIRFSNGTKKVYREKHNTPVWIDKGRMVLYPAFKKLPVYISF